MDWTKAKTILIIALLITNVFLIVLYVGIKGGEEAGEERLEADTLALLEEKNIIVKGGLPSNHQRMPVLMVRFDSIDQDALQEELSKQTPWDEEDVNRDSASAMAKAFLKSSNLWDENTVLSKIEQAGKGWAIHYRNEYEGIPLEESYMICTVQDGIISDVDRFWLKPTGFGKSKKTIISASAALMDLVRGKNENESILVEEMKIVYWLDTSAYGGEAPISDTALPAWKIIYNHGQIRYVAAYID